MTVIRRTSLGILALGLAFTATPLMAQQDEQRGDSDPMPMPEEEEYYLYEDNSKQVVDYREDKIVRVCAGPAPHDVTLTVRADEREIEIWPGDCIRVEAKQVFLEPSKHLPDLAMIKVGVQTIDYDS